MKIGKMRTITYMITAALAAVHRKVMTVVLITLPARLALFIFAIAEEMEKNTIGTTTQNIRLTKIVPSHSSAVAPGHTAPTMQPAMIPTSIRIRKP